MGHSAGNSKYRERRKREYACHLGRKKLPFCWTCRSGVQICPRCLEENMWGMSNGVVCICPDCGEMRSF